LNYIFIARVKTYTVKTYKRDLLLRQREA